MKNIEKCSSKQRGSLWEDVFNEAIHNMLGNEALNGT